MPPCIRVASTALAFEPAPPATVALMSCTLGYSWPVDVEHRRQSLRLSAGRPPAEYLQPRVRWPSRRAPPNARRHGKNRSETRRMNVAARLIDSRRLRIRRLPELVPADLFVEGLSADAQAGRALRDVALVLLAGPSG